MKELKGTKTEKNLMEAFAGESQAHTKYLYYASKAKKEGFTPSISIMPQKQRRMAMYRFPISSQRPPLTKKSMPNFGSNTCMEVKCLPQHRT